MSQKGFTPILIILGVILVIGIVAGAYYFGTNNKTQPQTQVVTQTPSIQATSSPIPPSSVIKLSDAWNLGLKTYSSPKIDITFDYPSYFDVKEIDIQKENADWAAKYKDNPDVRQPLYTSNFYATFNTTPNDPSAPVNREIWDNKMTVSVQKFDNSKNLSLYDYIADSHQTYPGDGITETFETYKKDLKLTN